MESNDKITDSGNVEMYCSSAYDEAEPEQVLVVEWAVPVAAKVPAPCQYLAVAPLVVQQASVTSTVPGQILTQLRANNTAQSAAWCITATLASPPSAQPLPRC